MAETTITLAAPGERKVVTVEQAEALLESTWEPLVAAAATEGSTVTALDLSCRAWPLATLEVFRYILTQHLGTIQTLQIDDIIASLMTEDGLASLGFFAQVFQDSTAVQEVNLNDNALGIRGIQTLKPLLQTASLRRLYLENTGLSKESCTVLKQVLQPVAPHLQALTLGRNALQADGAVIVGLLLQELPALEHFSYAGTRPLVEGTRHICQGLATHATLNLTFLDLNDCTFKSGDDDDTTAPVFALVDLLHKAPDLRTLILRDGELTASGAERVLEALRTSGARLEHFDLAGNELEAEGATSVMEYLAESADSCLHTLALDTNELEDEGVEIVAKALCQGFSKLHTLRLGCNGIEEAGTQVLVNHKLEALQILDLEDNMDLSPKGVKSLLGMYKTVIVDEDLIVVDDGEEEDDEDGAVDDLAAAMAGSQI